MRFKSIGGLFIFLSFVLTLPSLTSAQINNDEEPVAQEDLFYKKSDKLVLTYEEFRRLTPEHKEIWMGALRDFYTQVERIEGDSDIAFEVAEITPIEALPWLRVSALLPKWCSAVGLLGYSEKAQAADNCQVRYPTSGAHSGRMCLYCVYTASNIQQTVEECANSSDPLNNGAANPNQMAGEILQKYSSTHPEVKLNLSADKIATQVKAVQDDGGGSFAIPGAGAITAVGSTSGIITPSGPKVIQTDPDKALTVPTAADPLTVNQKRDAQGNIIEQKANVQGTAADYKLKSLGDTGSLKRNDNQDVDEYMAKAKLSCIYAGWALQGSGKDQKGRCQAVSEKVIANDKGVKTKYSCKKAPKTAAVAKAGESNYPVVYGDNKSGKATVLCNPVVFGLQESKPICVARGKNATEQCSTVAKKTDPDGKNSLPFAQNNPDQYRELTRRVETLCEQDPAALTKHFTSRGENAAAAKRSLQDLSNTCKFLRDRMADLSTANARSGAAKAGVGSM